MSAEKLQRPGKEAAGSRHESRVGRQTASAEGESIAPQTRNLMEEVLRRENLFAAFRRVQANKGAPGGDGMTVNDLPESLRQVWPEIREQLLSETYVPAPVRAVYLPKPGGGTRTLGIPTVLDRLIAQAILQVLVPIFDPDFSERSDGFRPGRSAHQALEQACHDMAEGYRWVVNIDLEKFFGAPGKARRFQRVQFPPRQEASHLTGNRVLGAWRERHGLSVDRATHGP